MILRVLKSNLHKCNLHKCNCWLTQATSYMMNLMKTSPHILRKWGLRLYHLFSRFSQNLRKSAIRSVMSTPPSARMKQLGSPLADFHEI